MAWEIKQLSDVAFLQRGFDITAALQEVGPIPVVSSSGVTSYHSKAMVDGPGVVVGRKGTLGKVHYIQANLRRIGLLEEAARLIYREWFVHLRFPGHECVRVVDGVPKAWDSMLASECLEVLSGGTPKTADPANWGGDIPFFTPKDHAGAFYVLDTEKHLSDIGLSNCNSRLFPKDTVFITARGTVGKIALAQRPMAMNQSCYALVGRNHLTQMFTFMAIREAAGQLQQAATGGVFDTIIVDTFKQLSLLVPPPNLMNEFDATIHPIFTKIDTLLRSNQRLQSARDLLLPRLMSGSLEVP